MNLIVDLGNSFSKAAIYSGNKLIKLKFFKGEITIGQLSRFTGKRPKIKAAILSSVINHSPHLRNYLHTNYYFVELNALTSLPFKNLYKTPGTLGKDRIANAAGACFYASGNDVLCIDAGTCIKYDFVNSKNEYKGGAISPGIEMRFKALNQFTAKLPLIAKTINPPPLTGKTTKDSILSGVQNGALAEISGIISLYKKKYPALITIFTGGDHLLFKQIISKKNRIFAVPDLTLLGLNTILNFNNEFD